MSVIVVVNCWYSIPSVLWCCWLVGKVAGMVICLERGADLHTSQLMPLPLTVSCFCKIQICLTFLVPAHPCTPGQRAIKRVCVCVCWCRAELKATIDPYVEEKTLCVTLSNYLRQRYGNVTTLPTSCDDPERLAAMPASSSPGIWHVHSVYSLKTLITCTVIKHKAWIWGTDGHWVAEDGITS